MNYSCVSQSSCKLCAFVYSFPKPIKFFKQNTFWVLSMHLAGGVTFSRLFHHGFFWSKKRMSLEPIYYQDQTNAKCEKVMTTNYFFVIMVNGM